MVYRLECPCGCFYSERTKHKPKARLAEHKHAIRTGNPQHPMALHDKESDHRGVDHISNSVRSEDSLKRLLQRDLFSIYTLKATQYPGLNEELDFSPFQ